MKFTHLVVGLGNPEGKYFSTYHNIGFMTAESIAKVLECEFKKKGNQMLATAGRTIILKPLTYMNLSGQAVVAVCRKHKIPPENVVAIADDLYIDKGHIRVSFGGSGGGHNGLKSITELLGTPKYARIRVGIRPEKEPHSMAQYVLSKITKDEQPLIDKSIHDAGAAAIAFIQGDTIEHLQGKWNSRNAKSSTNI